MALVDPNIAMGYRGIEMPNQLAQYGQLAAIQNAQNQNSLAQYQLSSAQRADEQQNNLYAAARQPGFKLDFSTAIQYGPAGVAAFKAQEDAAGTALTRTKTQGDIDAAKFKLKKDQLDFGWNAVGSAPTAQDAIEKINQGVKDGHFDMKSATQDIQRLQSMTSPEDYQKYRIEKILGLVDAKDKLGFMLPKNVRQDIGGKIVTMQDNPMLPGYSLPVQGMDITKTPTIGDRTAQGQLGLAQQKFAYEKANPTKTIQDTPSGLLAIDKNGVATPVVYGPNGIVAAASPSGSATALPTGTPGTAVMGRQSELKPIPSNVNLAILKNNQSIQQIDDTIKLLQQNPDATGFKGYLPNFALNRMNPEGTEARAGVADIGSIVLHDRSGAAVTAAESPRLMPFIPLATDDNATVIKKLTRMRNLAAQDQTGLTETYGKDQGYQPNPVTNKNSGTSPSAQALPPIYATNGNQRIVSTDGGQNWTLVK